MHIYFLRENRAAWKDRRGPMENLHKALETVAPHVGEGSQIFIHDKGNYHKFRIEGGRVRHTESHSSSHVEQGRGCLTSPCFEVSTTRGL